MYVFKLFCAALALGAASAGRLGEVVDKESKGGERKLGLLDHVNTATRQHLTEHGIVTDPAPAPDAKVEAKIQKAEKDLQKILAVAEKELAKLAAECTKMKVKAELEKAQVDVAEVRQLFGNLLSKVGGRRKLGWMDDFSDAANDAVNDVSEAAAAVSEKEKAKNVCRNKELSEKEKAACWDCYRSVENPITGKKVQTCLAKWRADEAENKLPIDLDYLDDLVEQAKSDMLEKLDDADRLVAKAAMECAEMKLKAELKKAQEDVEHASKLAKQLFKLAGF